MAARTHGEGQNTDGQTNFNQNTAVSLQTSTETDFSDADSCPLKDAALCHLAAGCWYPAVPCDRKITAPLPDDEFYALSTSINRFAATLKKQLRDYQDTYILLRQLHLFPRHPRDPLQPGLECTTHEQLLLKDPVESKAKSSLIHYTCQEDSPESVTNLLSYPQPLDPAFRQE